MSDNNMIRVPISRTYSIDVSMIRLDKTNFDKVVNSVDFSSFFDLQFSMSLRNFKFLDIMGHTIICVGNFYT